jgi:hypothetical protein
MAACGMASSAAKSTAKPTNCAQIIRIDMGAE